MKKTIITTLFIGILSSTTFAAWSAAGQVNKLKIVNDNRVMFTTTVYPNDGRWLVFDGSTTVGKSMLSILIASKTSGISIKYDEGGSAGATGYYYATQVELQ